MNAINAQPIFLKDYKPSGFLIDSVELFFDLYEEATIVKTLMQVKRNEAAKSRESDLILNGEELSLLSIHLDGDLLTHNRYAVDDRGLIVRNVPDHFVLETEVEINPKGNTQLMGLYQSRGNFCTQCEAEGFRRITYFLDRPDVMTRFTTTIAADKTKYPALLSNGNLIETKELPDNRHWVKWKDPSLKPCYLFALVAGDFDLLEDTFITMSHREIKLRLYLEKGYKDQGSFALNALKKAMKWDEDTWGREYDLDIYMIVAVSDFNMGAMENKGLNIFNTKYILAKPETATDTDYTNIITVIGHEYFHNWSGNRVTCRDWFQITLKEGLTVFRDQAFTEDMVSRGSVRLDSVNVVRTQQFAEDAGPLSHPIRPESYIEINNFYTTTVYRKGAEVIRMVQTLIGKEKFREGLEHYFYKYDGQAVTTEDFIKAMEEASGKDLSQFRLWYSQAGTPVLSAHGEYNEAKHEFTLTVRQSTPVKQMPLLMGLIGDACDNIPGTSRTLDITKEIESFVFKHVDHKPVPSLLRGFSAPVKLHYPYTDEELSWLLQCDTDPFARWDAGQTLAIRFVERFIAAEKEGKSIELDEPILKAYRHLLQHETGDLNMLSRLLVLPDESYVLANLPGTDVDAIHRARNFIKRTIAKQCEDLFQDHYKKLNSSKAYVYNDIEMGKRSFKNVCLSYLCNTKNKAQFQRAHQQFTQSNNMTDTIGAMLALNNHPCDERESVLNEFIQKWQREMLVVNKWLLLQASTSIPDLLQRIQSIMQAPFFDAKNPNMNYSLLGGFGANQIQFHQKSGEGYRFIADQVLRVDQFNHQVAGRLIQPLTRWDVVDSVRQKLMQKELDRIASASGLSKDIYEVASKSIKS